MREEKHDELISDMMAFLDAEDAELCRRITDYLAMLEYVPQKLKVRGYVLAFKNRRVNQTIAKSRHTMQ